jgi:methylglutaconyl-CoA hydratase
MMEDPVLYSVDNGIATVRLNRPSAHNALDWATGEALIACMEQAASDNDARVVVLAADGPTFSAGGDFNWVLGWPKLSKQEQHAGAKLLSDAVQAIYDLPKPSIARVQGATVGGGIGMMLACDYAVVADNTRFGLTSVRNGLLAGIAIPELIQALGARKARQLLLHGGVMPADQALEIGLVDRVVPAAMLDDEVQGLAYELKQGAPTVQALIKRLVTEMSVAARDEKIAARIADEVAAQCTTPDAGEGMSAFLQKRKAAWTK